MDIITPEMQNLARWLLASEAAIVEPADPPGKPGEATVQAAVCVRVCEKLRKPLVTLTGVAGYRALISRALALAKAGVPSLGSLRVREDGLLEGPYPAEPGRKPGEAQVGGAALVAQLLGLLVTFIGAALTMQLVRDVWPDAPFDDTGSETENI